MLRVADTAIRHGMQLDNTLGREPVPGLMTQASRGTAVVFWTLNPRGPVDQPWQAWEREPLSWHGGVGVTSGGVGKWILQKFVELPPKWRAQQQ